MKIGLQNVARQHEVWVVFHFCFSSDSVRTINMATFLVRRNMIIGTFTCTISALKATKSTNSSWVNMRKSVNSSMYS